MLKYVLLVSVFLVASLSTSAAHTKPENSVDRLTEHYQNIWRGVMSHICEGNLWAYHDPKTNRRVLPEDITCSGIPSGFAATFNHTITGPRSETTLAWLAIRVFNTLFHVDSYVYIKYEDLYPLLSHAERSDLETMSFLFRNTAMYAENYPCQQSCATALYNNMAETEHAYFQMQSYDFLTPLVSFQITETLVDSIKGPQTFLDKKFRKPLELWKATQTEVHQIADKQFPGEFKDSVVVKAYGIYSPQLQFNGGTLAITFNTGETLYCRTEDFLAALPGWCAHFVPIIYDL